MPYIVNFENLATVGLESSPGCVGARWATRQRGALLQEQIRSRLHRQPGRRGARDARLGEPRPLPRARHRHLRPSARGDFLRGGRSSDGLRVLRVRPVNQRDVRHRRRGEARSRVQVLRGHGSPGGAGFALQVCAAKVEARRRDPRLLLRDQGRILEPETNWWIRTQSQDPVPRLLRSRSRVRVALGAPTPIAWQAGVTAMGAACETPFPCAPMPITR